MGIDFEDYLYHISLNYIKKERFTGSMDGTRFLLEKKTVEIPVEEGEKPKDPIVTLRVCIWPEPNCFEKTEKSLIKETEYPFSEEGLKRATEYLKSLQNA